ncbi:queuosine 5'-phosphate N-glycosylase/hydrolase isoform X2 [Trichechus manatus latirostris]|uniref:Queuosine 5'-phosphate N-glycosylase/hydrolase n=1 Tax=Trichechus manatus latirostris TaxID=127582 RepID=A0A2Y9RAS0_TRIMA|nr:queuosine 5'-phosphate N-glycosylase/hydrolase isoform X2 [Trichechus manatus latirostris]
MERKQEQNGGAAASLGVGQVRAGPSGPETGQCENRQGHLPGNACGPRLGARPSSLRGFGPSECLGSERSRRPPAPSTQGIPITSASYYATVTLEQVQHIFRSDTDVPMPLIEERHRILNETGKILLEKFEGSFLNCVRKSEQSAQKLMHLVVESFPSYRDVTQFEGKRISFYKRAQILVADTWSVLEGQGDGCFKDISSITMFADYRLPQVLLHLGALRYSDELQKKLLKGEMLSYGDKQEVEIRGCSVWCVELIRDCLLELIEKKGEKISGEINSILLDYYLWDYARDHRADMNGIPFHHTRCIYY